MSPVLGAHVLENKRCRSNLEWLEGALLAEKAGALFLLRTPLVPLARSSSPKVVVLHIFDVTPEF